MKKIFIHSFKTQWGLFRLAATQKGLVIVTLPGEREKYFQDRISKFFPEYEIYNGGQLNKKAASQINAYLHRDLKRFKLPLDIRGTEFQRKVLKKVAQIPFGATMTYGEIAEAIGKPKAYRAVGSANAKNNLPLVIPCHRVVASHGLGGYGGGLKLKKKLLKLEGAL